MKNTPIILTVILILLAAIMVSSCEESVATQAPGPPPGPDPMQVLKERICTERRLREDAEAKAEDEAERRGQWELAALGLGALGVVGFFAGTAIGSKGRHHAGPSN